MNSYRQGLRSGVLVNTKLFILEKVNICPTYYWLVNLVKLGQTWLKTCIIWCRSLHKPLKLLKLYLENMGYKIFHFSIIITPLNFSKIRQHNYCTVVKPKIQKSHVYKKIHSQYFSKPNYNHKDLWSSSKYKIKIN